MFKQHSFYFFLSALFFFLLCIRFVLRFDGLYGQDAYEYLRYTEALKNYLITNKPPGDYFWGVYYPILGCVFCFVVPTIPLALQLISVLSLFVTTIYLEKTIRLVHCESELMNIPFLFFTLSPIVFIHGFLVMSDLLSCCFTTLAIYFILHFWEAGKSRFFILGIVFAFLAILTRYAAAVILFPFYLAGFLHLIKNKKYALILTAIPTVILITLPHLLIRSQNSMHFLSHQWLQSWNISNLLKSDFITPDGQSTNFFINLIYAFFSFVHPAFIFPGTFLLIFLFKKNYFQLRKNHMLLLGSIILYGFFLGGIPFQNKRFLLLSFPLVIVFLFPIIKLLLIRIKHQNLVFGFIISVQLSLALYYGKPYYERNILEKNIAVEMHPYQGKILYVFDIDISMQGQKLNFIYKNLWLKKYADFENNALVLVNEKQLKKQWKGKNPLLNWENIKTNYKISKLKILNGDFNLYRIEAKK